MLYYQFDLCEPHHRSERASFYKHDLAPCDGVLAADCSEGKLPEFGQAIYSSIFNDDPGYGW